MTPFVSERVNESKTLLKPARQHFYLIYSSFWKTLSWKTSLLLTSKTLGLFINTLTADDKYSCNKRESFVQAIKIQLSKKPRIFFIAFLKFT